VTSGDYVVKVNQRAADAPFELHGEGEALIFVRLLGEAVAQHQRQNAPVQTGRMRDSVVVDGPHSDFLGVYCDVGPTATTPDGFPYPLVVEYGAKEHDGVPARPAHPFIRPSVSVLQRVTL